MALVEDMAALEAAISKNKLQREERAKQTTGMVQQQPPIEGLGGCSDLEEQVFMSLNIQGNQGELLFNRFAGRIYPSLACYFF